MFLQWLCSMNSDFLKKVFGMWTFSGKNQLTINNLRTFELVVSFIVRQRPYSLGSSGAHKWWPPLLKSPQWLLMEVTTAYAADWPHATNKNLAGSVWLGIFHRQWQFQPSTCANLGSGSRFSHFMRKHHAGLIVLGKSRVTKQSWWCLIVGLPEINCQGNLW